MDKLVIGEVIYRLRKEKSITQEQLANFIGVSTAAVSKWESGASYPDITLLPVLATFFNVTIDKLLNFKIDISKEEVMKLFKECEAAFSSNENFNAAVELSEDYMKKYPSSYLLKFRIAYLFFAYSWKGGNEEKYNKMIKYSIELLEEVVANSVDVELVEPSLFQLGALYSDLEEYDKAVEVLNKIHRSNCDPNDILSSVYIRQGKLKEARRILQSKLYKSIHDISLTCMSLAGSYRKYEKDFDIAERYSQLPIKFKQATALNLFMEYYNLAEIYIQKNDNHKAIETLKLMLEEIKKQDINKVSQINNIWCFNDMEVGERLLTMNLYENISKMLEDPSLDPIRENGEFTDIVEEVRALKDRAM